jgi:DNA-binding XRE family transcriptional regulator
MENSMKIDANLVKNMREERSWSQDHLATVAGVSLRTIQRLESEGSASLETRMALASAFGIPAAKLLPSQPTRAQISRWHKLGVACGTAGALTGLLFSWSGALASAAPVGQDSGVTYGVMGALTGITFAFIGTIVGSLRRKG